MSNPSRLFPSQSDSGAAGRVRRRNFFEKRMISVDLSGRIQHLFKKGWAFNSECDKGISVLTDVGTGRHETSKSFGLFRLTFRFQAFG